MGRTGCLLWIVAAILLVLLLSLLFGGFQQGTKVSLGAAAAAGRILAIW
jgi:hypothetical protein